MKIREMQARLQQSRGYKWWVLGMIMLGTFMAVLDVTVVNVGIPTIMSAFHIRISSAEWVITAYMITMTIMLPSAGWLADPVRQQETLLGWNGYFYVGIVALRACGNRRFPDCCTGVTGSWQRHDPVARTGHRHA